LNSSKQARKEGIKQNYQTVFLNTTFFMGYEQQHLHSVLPSFIVLLSLPESYFPPKGRALSSPPCLCATSSSNGDLIVLPQGAQYIVFVNYSPNHHLLLLTKDPFDCRLLQMKFVSLHVTTSDKEERYWRHKVISFVTGDLLVEKEFLVKRICEVS
jgi:hypothetical protein